MKHNRRHGSEPRMITQNPDDSSWPNGQSSYKTGGQAQHKTKLHEFGASHPDVNLGADSVQTNHHPGIILGPESARPSSCPGLISLIDIIL